jgi:hypothetical protein
MLSGSEAFISSENINDIEATSNNSGKGKGKADMLAEYFYDEEEGVSMEEREILFDDGVHDMIPWGENDEIDEDLVDLTYVDIDDYHQTDLSNY